MTKTIVDAKSFQMGFDAASDEIAQLKLDNAILTKQADDDVDEMLKIQEQIEQLQKLRKSLEACKFDCNTGEVIGIAAEALSTPAQSLTEIDDAIDAQLSRIGI